MTRAIAAAGVFALLLSGCSGSRTAAGGAPPSPSKPTVITVQGAPNTIPEGTTLEVRTSEEINTKSAEGRTYQGSIATEVIDAQGKVLLPRGAKVELVILEAKEKSGVKGASLQLGLRSVTVEGNTYLVISEERKETSRLGNQSSNGADRRRWSSTWHANRSCRRWRWWRRSGWTDRGGRRSGSSSSHAGERGSHPGGVCSSFPVG